jgi:hypothetical protein
MSARPARGANGVAIERGAPLVRSPVDQVGGKLLRVACGTAKPLRGRRVSRLMTNVTTAA